MNAQAPRAQAQESLLASASAIHRSSAAGLTAAETSLPSSLRLRASLLGTALALAALAAATAGGLAIATGPFHTPLGSLA